MGTASNYGEEFRASLHKAILDEAPDGILVVDGNGFVVSVNRPFFGIWNIPGRPVSWMR
jgi:PAS domain-containing protein